MLIPCLIILLAFAVPANAQPIKDAGRAMGEALLAEIDADGSGTLEPRELERLATLLHVDMDADGSGGVTRHEMTIWRGDGMRDLATFRGREMAHSTISSLLFEDADRDVDGDVTSIEMTDALKRAADHADRDGDGVTTLSEFDRHSILAIGLRNAVGTPPS